MKEINITKDSITIALPRKLSERQRFILKSLTKDLGSLEDFLDSFKGRRFGRGYVYSDTLKSRGHDDDLEGKKAGSILEMYRAKRSLFATNLEPTKGIEPGRAIGIEIECYVPMTMKQLEEKFLETKITNVRAASDGSIRAEEGYNEVEFRVLSNLGDDLKNLRELCDFLSSIGAKVNRSCGLHVHLDARGYERTPLSIVNRLRAALPMLCAMVPRSRIDNTYCRQDVSRRGDRYAKINTQSFRKHRTIEVRLHSGTCDFLKISSWIKILHSIAFSKKRVEDTSVLGFASKLSWDASLVIYIFERIRKFNPSFLGETQEPTASERDEENREIPVEFHCDSCETEISRREASSTGLCECCYDSQCEAEAEAESAA